MRKAFAVLLGAIVLCVGLAAPAASAGPARPRLYPVPVTSKITPFDVSATFGQGDGGPGDYWSKQVSATVLLRHCPAAAGFTMNMSLTQDGVSYPWATAALGAGEFFCRRVGAWAKVTIPFWGDHLHPGLARLVASVQDEETGQPIATATGRVLIPRH